ncbi:hypothetical protein OC834_007511, partial [Tilletia horrida]
LFSEVEISRATIVTAATSWEKAYPDQIQYHFYDTLVAAINAIAYVAIIKAQSDFGSQLALGWTLRSNTSAGLTAAAKAPS